MCVDREREREQEKERERERERARLFSYKVIINDTMGKNR
jgi:hypothetical protein